MVHSRSELCGTVPPFFFPAQSLSEKAVTEVGIRRKPEAKKEGQGEFQCSGKSGTQRVHDRGE